MADLSDVENAIIALIAATIYPNGPSQPSIVLNEAGAPLPVRIFRGWPVPAELDRDLALGTANISLFTRGVGANHTRYALEWEAVNVPASTASTVSATVVDNKITLSGSGNVNVTQYVSVNIGGRIGVSVPVGASDTAASIATALAAAITTAFAPATAANGVITVNSSVALTAITGVAVGELLEVRRNSESLHITLWCPTPLTRDNLSRALEPVLANTPFLTAADGTAVRFRYASTTVSDDRETVQLYRRDLFYDVEYATTIADTAFEVTLPSVTIEAMPAGAVAADVPAVAAVYPLPPVADDISAT